MDAERARLVSGGGDHAARMRIAAPADHHRPADQFGMALELDRGEEGVHVDVEDAARAHRSGKPGAGFFQPGEDLVRQPVAVFVAHLPQRRAGPALRLGDEALPLLRDRRDDAAIRIQQAPHGGDEARRQALHLADLVDEVDRDFPVRREQRFGAHIERRDIDAVFGHFRAADADVREDERSAAEVDQAKAGALPRFAQLLGVKAAHVDVAKPLGDAPNHRGLAHARGAGDEQDARGLVHVLSGHSHTSRSTHTGQCGLRAMQVSRPCRIRALPNAVHLFFATWRMSSASTFSGSSECTSPRRLLTRSTCVSTAMAGTPNALPSTMLAVLRPTPGSVTSSSSVRGTSPWKSVTSFWQQAMTDLVLFL